MLGTSIPRLLLGKWSFFYPRVATSRLPSVQSSRVSKTRVSFVSRYSQSKFVCVYLLFGVDNFEWIDLKFDRKIKNLKQIILIAMERNKRRVFALNLIHFYNEFFEGMCVNCWSNWNRIIMSLIIWLLCCRRWWRRWNEVGKNYCQCRWVQNDGWSLLQNAF